jgi:hypothetical protein
MQDTKEIVQILDAATKQRTSGPSGQVVLYREHVERAAEVIRALTEELGRAKGGRKCERASWCVYESGHGGECSLIRPRVVEVTPMTLGIATDALNLADEFLDDVHEEGDSTRKRKVQVEIDIALDELARAQGITHVRCYDNDGKALHGEDEDA